VLFFKKNKKAVAKKESIKNTDLSIPHIDNSNLKKIEKERERYRLSLDDARYFILAYIFIIFVSVLFFIYDTRFFLRWNILFLGSLVLPYFVLSVKGWFISRKRRKKYVSKMISESSSEQYENLLVFYYGETDNNILSGFEIKKQVYLDTRFAFNKLHEVKRYAIKNHADAVVDLRFYNNGITSFYLATKK